MIFIGLSTTATFAGNQLKKVASSQESLSHTLIRTYQSRHADQMIATVKRLEAGHARLHDGIRDQELKNLIVYLQLCLKDLEKLSHKPYSTQNAKRVADLSSSLSEGNHYILSSL